MKKLIIIILIIAIIGVPIYLVLDTQNSHDDFYTQLNDFNVLIKNQEYDKAKLIYEQSSNTLKANYNISLDALALTLVEETKKQNTTQSALDLLYEYNEIGYKSNEI